MRHLQILVLLIASVCWSVVPAATASVVSTLAASDVTTHLPRNVRPGHYDIDLTPDAASLTFKATVFSDILILRPTSTITLNAEDLAFSKVRLTRPASIAPADPSRQLSTNWRPSAHGCKSETAVFRR